MKLIKKVWLPLAAAALTAVAFAAVSVAQSGDSDKRGDEGPGVAIASPGGPPMLFERLSDEDRKALDEFRSCMEDQGVEPPPEFKHRIDPPSQEERAKVEEAFEACEDKLPEGARQFGPHPCGPPPGAPEGEGTAIPAPPPSSGSPRS